MRHQLTFFFVLLFTSKLFASVPELGIASDLGFRYADGKCINLKGEEGLNPFFLGPCSDFRNILLGRVDLSNLDLSGSKFTNSELQLINFSKTILVGVDFQNAKMIGLDFSEAVIRNATFSNAIISNLQISDTIFENVSFVQTNISKSQLAYFLCRNCDLSGLRLSTTNFENAQFFSSILDNVNFSGANLKQAIFNGSSLKTTNFTKANLIGADFRGSELANNVFKNAKLNGADLRKSNLMGADLSELDLSSTNISSAILTGANFDNSILPKGYDFGFQNLVGCSFVGAKLINAIFKNTTLGQLSFKSANLSGADFRGMNLAKFDFSEARLDSTRLSGTMLKGANFSAATLIGLDLSDFDLTEASFVAANLDGILLERANAPGVSFHNANLSANTKLTGANLENSDLRNANFTGINLAQVVLKGSKFNKKTQMQYSMDEAKKIGMTFVNTKTVLAWTAFADNDTDSKEEAKNTLDSIKRSTQDLELIEDREADVAKTRAYLNGADVFLVPEMEKGSNSVYLKAIGPDLLDFVKKGKVVVATADYTNFLQQSQLLPQIDCIDSSFDSGEVDISAPEHPLMKGLLKATVTLANATYGCDVQNDPDVTVLVGSKSAAFVFIKQIGKGYVIELGYDFYEYNADAEKILGNAVNFL